MAVNPNCRTPSPQEFFGKCAPKAYSFLENGGYLNAAQEAVLKAPDVQEMGPVKTIVDPVRHSGSFRSPRTAGYVVAGIVVVSVAAYWFYTHREANRLRGVDKATSLKVLAYIEDAKQSIGDQKTKERRGGDP